MFISRNRRSEILGVDYPNGGGHWIAGGGARLSSTVTDLSLIKLHRARLIDLIFLPIA